MPTTNDVFDLRINYVNSSDRMTSVLHFVDNQTVSATPEADATKLVTAFVAATLTQLLACFPTTTQLTSISSRRINQLGGPSYYLPFAASTIGTGGSGAKIDGAISALLVAGYNNADLGGPNKFRVGRVFMGSVPSLWLTENQFSSAAVSAYTNFANSLNAGYVGSPITWTPVIWSPKYQAYTNPVVWTFSPTVAALRKRQFPAR